MSFSLNNPIRYQNAIVIRSDTSSITDAYNFLKSPTLNGEMGVPSATNKRFVIRTPGTYIQNLSIDKKYVYLYDYPGVVDSGKITYTPAWYGPAFGNGSGDSKTNALNIDSVEAYHAFTADVNNWNKYFLLTADLDFKNKEVFPVGYGTGSTKFTGVFDGNGYSLSNFVMNFAIEASNNIALFRQVGATGVVTNLTVFNAIINGDDGTKMRAGGNSYAAVFVGETTQSSIKNVTNCTAVNCTVFHYHTLSAQYGFAGMIVGANHGNIDGCTVIGGRVGASATAGNGICIGGIVASPWATGTCNNCISSAKITSYPMVSSTASVYIGGIAGFVNNTAAGVAISSNKFVGSIDYECTLADPKLLYCGGIAGFLGQGASATADKNSVSTSIKIVNKGTGAYMYVAGLIGSIPNDGGNVVSNSSANFVISIDDTGSNWAFVGGLIGYCTDHTVAVSNCYAKGSFIDLHRTPQTSLFYQVGGCFGSLTHGTVTNCWCAITPYTAYNSSVIVCAFTGNATGNATLTGCFWDKSTNSNFTHDGIGGAVGKTTAELQTAATFSTYDFDIAGGRKWKMLDGYDYPKLEYET